LELLILTSAHPRNHRSDEPETFLQRFLAWCISAWTLATPFEQRIPVGFVGFPAGAETHDGAPLYLL